MDIAVCWQRLNYIILKEFFTELHILFLTTNTNVYVRRWGCYRKVCDCLGCISGTYNEVPTGACAGCVRTYLFIGGSPPCHEDTVETGEANDWDTQEPYDTHDTQADRVKDANTYNIIISQAEFHYEH